MVSRQLLFRSKPQLAENTSMFVTAGAALLLISSRFGFFFFFFGGGFIFEDRLRETAGNVRWRCAQSASGSLLQTCFLQKIHASTHLRRRFSAVIPQFRTGFVAHLNRLTVTQRTPLPTPIYNKRKKYIYPHSVR